MPRLDVDDHAPQIYRFHVQVLWEPDVKEVVPQVEVGFNPHESPAQIHKGCGIKDPRGGHIVQLQAVILQQRAEESVRWHNKSTLVKCRESHLVSLH
jgi:hypothetical protein